MVDFLDSPLDPFTHRHIGPSSDEVEEMLAALGLESLDEFIDAVVPEAIRYRKPLELGSSSGEYEQLGVLRSIAEGNEVFRSYIGMGYHATVTPPVILRNVLENPGWYTQYTPYQAEIAQGRLEALINFQTLVAELSGLPLANASLLDEGTAAAEAMNVCWAIGKKRKNGFFVADDCHPQTLAVVRTRAEPLGIQVHIGPWSELRPEDLDLCGALVQYPTTDGGINDYSELADRLHEAGALLVVAADLLALTLLRPPGEFGADIAVGSSQRLGVPLGYGGPHAGFMATSERQERLLPGRIVGVSKDTEGRQAFRLARQTREQHIRREKATSNICTAQVLPAVLASMYAVYHGPAGLARIARRVRAATNALAAGLRRLGLDPGDGPFFDTLRVATDRADSVAAAAAGRKINLRRFDDGTLGVTLDETVGSADLQDLLNSFAEGLGQVPADVSELNGDAEVEYAEPLGRTSPFLEQEIFNSIKSEHQMLRYLFRLQERDLSLAHSMIPLGSCTMKLNATAEMIPISWPEFAALHPFAPADQCSGYLELFAQLERWLGAITGLPAVSLQPNAGSQGELAGLLTIRSYHKARGEADRDVCLVPISAHGTNPASSVMAGMRVVPVAVDDQGGIDLDDLRRLCEQHRDRLSAIMITYPSTTGVFDEDIVEICDAVHQNGGQVYLDGANLNAQVGLCRPAEIGADVCHLNLHKTFCIPHGGGGPGMGPICAAEHLAPHLPGHPLSPSADHAPEGAIAAAPYGSPSILPISWMYIALMGGEGLRRASQVAILSANYMAKRLSSHYPILYHGRHGFHAHEFIIDLREFRKSADINVDDVAKRLMDFGFHAPTMAWPVAGTMMIEPTESETKDELDRYCDAMIAIREEIRQIENGVWSAQQNPLKNAPHTLDAVTASEWPHPYSREQAAFPGAWLRQRKFWPPAARIDNAWGDRNLVCTCDPVSAYLEEAELEPV
jgi:glycine dehydrogenase